MYRLLSGHAFTYLSFHEITRPGGGIFLCRPPGT
jgi:hypothetical protein